jgi:hypothetical protein
VFFSCHPYVRNEWLNDIVICLVRPFLYKILTASRFHFLLIYRSAVLHDFISATLLFVYFSQLFTTETIFKNTCFSKVSLEAYLRSTNNCRLFSPQYILWCTSRPPSYLFFLLQPLVINN